MTLYYVGSDAHGDKHFAVVIDSEVYTHASTTRWQMLCCGERHSEALIQVATLSRQKLWDLICI